MRTLVAFLDRSTPKPRLVTDNSSRPSPPPGVGETDALNFIPATDLRDWMADTFVSENGRLYNPAHTHLAQADIGVLWTNVTNNRQQRRIIGQAEQPNPKGGKWQVERQKLQMMEWFGSEPDFIITLDAIVLSAAPDRAFCAVIEHELFHCAHAFDEFGAPKFTRDGAPVFAIKGHDIEEFHGVIARYGLTSELRALLEAANQKPELPDSVISGACGTCLRKAA